jgi:hypothetical protein
LQGLLKFDRFAQFFVDASCFFANFLTEIRFALAPFFIRLLIVLLFRGFQIQGCQSFRGTKYQNGENIPNDDKLAIKYFQ